MKVRSKEGKYGKLSRLVKLALALILRDPKHRENLCEMI